MNTSASPFAHFIISLSFYSISLLLKNPENQLSALLKVLFRFIEGGKVPNESGGMIELHVVPSFMSMETGLTSCMYRAVSSEVSVNDSLVVDSNKLELRDVGGADTCLSSLVT